jgi:hypothetical protein
MVWSNPLRYAVVGGIGEIIMLLGKLMITAATVSCFYVLITFNSTAASSIQCPIAMLIVILLLNFRLLV